MIFAALLAAGCQTKSSEYQDSAAMSQQASSQDVQAAAENVQPAEISFEEKEYDFGTVNEGETVVHTFVFTNTGEVPLIIQNATASCGCTVPEWPKEPVPAGETGKIEVKFNTTGRPNQQSKTITITANTEPKMTNLKIKGMVQPKTDQAMGPVRRN